MFSGASDLTGLHQWSHSKQQQQQQRRKYILTPIQHGNNWSWQDVKRDPGSAPGCQGNGVIGGNGDVCESVRQVETLQLPASKHSQEIFSGFHREPTGNWLDSGLCIDWSLLPSGFVVRQRPLLAGRGSNKKGEKKKKKRVTKFVKTPEKMRAVV